MKFSHLKYNWLITSEKGNDGDSPTDYKKSHSSEWLFLFSAFISLVLGKGSSNICVG